MYEVQLQLIDRLEINLSCAVQNSQSFEVILSKQEVQHKKGLKGCKYSDGDLILLERSPLIYNTVTNSKKWGGKVFQFTPTLTIGPYKRINK